MKKFIAVCALVLGMQATANAGTITVNVSNNNVAVGETIKVDVIASGFAEFDTFDLDVDFDNSLFSYDASSLTSDLSTLMPLLFEVNAVNDGIAISFLDFFAFSGDFVLASFNVSAIAEGNTVFALSDVLFFDSFFASELTVDSSATAQATVQNPSVAVPAPSAFGLMILAIAFSLRKRLSH